MPNEWGQFVFNRREFRFYCVVSSFSFPLHSVGSSALVDKGLKFYDIGPPILFAHLCLIEDFLFLLKHGIMHQ